MGGSSYSDDLYKTRATSRCLTGTPVFAYDADVKSGKTSAAVNDKLNPKGITRESRDSDVHPESLAICVFFDVTGSMGRIPAELQKKLSTLMALLVSKGAVEHPQIMFGAVGDANSDVAPLQVGQFESGLEMEDDLSRIYLEGNGGGQVHETYELAHYFVAKHTVMDCFEKRGKKGYLFTMGDEECYPTVRADQVKALIGDELPGDLKTADVFRMAEERFHVFHLIVEEGSYRDNPGILKTWTNLLGERVLKVYDFTTIPELIASTIGVQEGLTLDEMADTMKDAGVSADTISKVSSALANYVPSAAMVASGSGTGLASGDIAVERI